MSDTDATSEQKEPNETSEDDNKSPYALEETDKHEELNLEEELDKPINSYASMIYFKEKQYIKEEPSSPGGMDCWKSDEHRTSPGGVIEEEPQQNSVGIKINDELNERAAKVVSINSSRSISSYTNKNCSSPTISSSNEYLSVSSSNSKEKDYQRAPRKPLTPYMSYRNMIFEEIKHKYPGCSPYDLACLISSKWSMLTDSERKVWEDQYEDEMKKYNDALQNIASNPSKREWLHEKKTDLQPPPIHPLKTVTSSRVEEVKSSIGMGMCKWCRRYTGLQDFTSVLDGREIYCTGLCSEKCFIEAAKQINTIEGGSNKPRYVKYNSQSKTSQSEDAATFTSGSRYSSSSSHSPLVNELHRNKSSSLFDWDSYLSMDSQSTAAHWMYFKQARYPPQNNFSVGMKLEACSYNAKNMSLTFSLATVVATCGSRILLHFDGADSKSDIWRLPDSGDIHPVGWTEGSLLKAPLGYKYDPAKYNKYFASNLQSAEIAPARLFKKEPQKPIENYFTVGMKLEAVNKQSPSIIGVASIVDVEGEQVKIEFDGYKGIGYWCHYYDRDLFPAGWCARSGHPLQPPGSKVSQLFQRQSQSSSSPPPSTGSGEPRSPLLSTSTYQRESVSSSWKEKSGSPNSVEVFISMECYCGPYIEVSKLKKLPRVYKGNMVTVLKNVLEDVIKCAIDPKTVFGFLKPGRGNCVIKAICDGVAFQCCLNSIDRVSTFWRVLEQFSDNLRCCPNMFSSTELRIACTRCNNNRTRSVSTVHEYQRVSTHHGKRHHPHHSSNYPSSSHRSETSRTEQSRHVTSRHERLSHTHSYSMSSYDIGRRGSEPDSPIVITTNSRKDSVFEPAVRSVSNIENIPQPEESKTSSRDENYDSEKEDVTVDDSDEPLIKKKKTQKRKVDGIDITTAPKSWSIDEVISFMEQSDLKDYVDRFRENEIDGKALLLLQRDLVLSHMGFKLGPAVKLLDMIEELKSVQESFI